MPQPIQSRTRQQIRQSIGRQLGTTIISTVSITKDTSSLWDTGGLSRGGTNEYVGRQVIIYDAAGSIVDGETSWVTAFDATEKDCTMAPAFTNNITILDKYEMWRGITIEEVNDAMDNAIMEVSDDALQTHQDTDEYTARNKLEYDIATFKGLTSLEYVHNVGVDKLIEDCDVLWTELVDGDVTATADTSMVKKGTSSLKLVVAAGAAANDILATEDIASLDLTDCDALEVWVYSGAAFAAGAIQVLLGSAAKCATAVESLDIPLTTATTWTRHVIDLANPHSDGAVISVGIKMITDATYTLYFDDIRGIKKNSREYKELHHDYWDVMPASTPKVKITPTGLSIMGYPTLMRWNGLKLPTLLTLDTTSSEVDPSWIIAHVVGTLLLTHTGVRSLNENADKRGDIFLKKAKELKASVTTQPEEW